MEACCFKSRIGSLRKGYATQSGICLPVYFKYGPKYYFVKFVLVYNVAFEDLGKGQQMQKYDFQLTIEL